MDSEDNSNKANTSNESKPKRFISEGSAEIISGSHVFYNPVQQFNRDLSVLILNVTSRIIFDEKIKRNKAQNPDNVKPDATEFEPGIRYEQGMRILEALSATGLRSIRYAKEVRGVKEVIANDISKNAVESIQQNIEHNNVKHLITASHADATTLMYLSTQPEKRFDAIDLDPYGCPNRFLDAAIQSVTNGGIILVTATDMAVLAGNNPESCFVKYGSVPLRLKAVHEMAIRILLRSIEGHANRYGKYIEPLLSISADFYIRVFVRVHTSQLKCKLSMSKQGMVFQCIGCNTLTFQHLGLLKSKPESHQIKFEIPIGPAVESQCEHCGYKHHMGGPIWIAPIHNKDFVQSLLTELKKDYFKELETYDRIVGMLTVIDEELLDVPLYYSVDQMCSVLRLEIIPILKFRSALLHAGYKVSFSHAYKNSIKTDAPPSVLWDILRCWNKIHPVKATRLTEGSVVKNILEKEQEKEYNITDIHPLANPTSRKSCLVRFPENPTAHWGPGTRATVMIGKDKIYKSFRNQNKKQKHKLEGNLPSNKHPKLEEDLPSQKSPKLEEDLSSNKQLKIEELS